MYGPSLNAGGDGGGYAEFEGRWAGGGVHCWIEDSGVKRIQNSCGFV